jgi:hypothetical protein
MRDGGTTDQMAHDETQPEPPPGPPAETELQQHEEPLASAAEHADPAGHGIPEDHATDPYAGTAHDPAVLGAEHGHDAAPLGPIDIPAWGAGVVGIAIGAVTLLAFALSTGALP